MVRRQARPEAHAKAIRFVVDTEFDASSGNFLLAYNKSELQYTYLLFENGGAPTVEIVP